MAYAGADGSALPASLSSPRPCDSRSLRLSPLRAATRLLRKPAVIVGELTAITLAGVLGATIPQSALTATGEIERAPSEPLASIVDLLGLDRIFGSTWFLALVVLVGCSLFLVWKDQWRRTWRVWRRPARGARLSGAPYRYEVGVPLSEPRREGRVRYRDSLRLGLWGSPVFHLGLLVLVVAGVLRLLLGADAVVDLVEGETLPPSPSAYGAQWPGLLARPFSLRTPLTLGRLRVDNYPDGSLRQLAAEVQLGGRAGGQKQTVAINDPLSDGTHSLYLTSTYGPTVLLTTDLGGALERHTLLLYPDRSGRYSGELQLGTGANAVRAVAFTRDRLDPAALEVRVLRGTALLAGTRLAPGEAIRFPDGRVLELRGTAQWARFTAQRDVSAPVAYTGFALACLGALLMYGIIRVESEVAWTPTPDGVRLTVAMRPQRFAPLFAPRFERLVAESRAELAALASGLDA